jgi:type III secretion system low calcium response chaperone LcrH/SycD
MERLQSKIKANPPKGTSSRFNKLTFNKYAVSTPCFFPYPNPSNILIHDLTTETIKRLRSGVKLLIKGYLNKCRDNLYDEYSNFPSEDLKNVVGMFSKCVGTLLEKDENGPRTLQEKFGLSHRTMDVFYEVAKELFDNEEYAEAEDAFFTLSLFNPLHSYYWIGLGMAAQKQQKYDIALAGYSMAAIIDVESSLPHMYAAQCFISVNKRYQARQAIKLALQSVDPDSEDYRKIKAFQSRL